MLSILVNFFMILFGLALISLFFIKKRLDNNEPILGWKRKQFLAEKASDEIDEKKVAKNKASLKELIGLKDIRYGVFEKARNEYSLIIATDSVNFDLLNPAERGTIILGYQSLFRVIDFPLQILGQAVRQDLRKEEERFKENLKDLNQQTKAYNESVISHIKMTSEQKFRIIRRTYYVVSYIYEPSKMAKLTPEQKEKKIVETLYQQSYIVMKMLSRARVKSEVLGSLEAMEVLKRALNRDRMLHMPIDTVVGEGMEKINQYITADPTTLPGFEDLVQDIEEVRDLVENS
ncbi:MULTISPECIES: hypothetical protein [Alkalihalophilus]|uniref:Uncharacterized protein n=1 Tax=Alkalihalophilus pseudofirmus (strain ATCC BAA-2126 / JCM 17055 / OF4) TaxID=398511 RepID=D3G193_ALKPO|nr:MULTISPECIES: hypothetical protein [Alkalihalophilus]ADC52119.1 hypothetical protein BpOF4_20619 [Alkalihalophilus pseudofirmus OF4]MEC2074230.1 hypothetical protein [Alkalihalophilus marmarensis]